VLERQGGPNAFIPSGDLFVHARMTAGARTLLRDACARLGLSARAHHRAIKVARTIADLAGAGSVHPAHLGEALRHRGFNVKALA
jgi:magnesium chelatase family protein